MTIVGAHHRRLRALVGPAFTPRAADRWRPVMREFLARPWDEDAPRLHAWSGLVQRQFDVWALSAEPARIDQACSEVHDHVEALLDRPRAVGDLLSALLAAEATSAGKGDRLSHDECVNLC